MNKKILCIVVLIFVNLEVFSQAYIAKDTLYYSNVNLLSSTPENNSLYVVLGLNNKRLTIVPVTGDTINGVLTKSVIYTPEMIDGYGFKDGRQYLSKEINLNGDKQKVFLQILSDGEKRLLLFSKKNSKYYFIETVASGNLVFLKGENKDELINELSDVFSDFDVTKGVHRKINYKEPVLIKLVNNYNLKSTSLNTFAKYGIIAGYFESSYNPKTEYDLFLKSLDNLKQNTFFVGLSADLPILKSQFAFHPELFFMSNNISYGEVDGDVEYTISVKNFSVNIPLMLKYSYEFKYLVPYINAGLIYTYNFSNENVYTQKEMDFTMDKTRFVELVSNNRFGYIAGFGVAKKINYASSVFIEIRYSSQGNFLSKSVDGDYLSKKDLGVVFGFNF